MKKRKIDIVVDTLFVVAVIFCLTISLIGCSTANADYKPTSTPSQEQEPVATEPPEEKPSVTLYDVPLDEELQLHIISEAEFHGIDPAIIFAMAFYESTYRTDAVNGGGYTLGLLQVQPRWHKKRMERLDCDDLLDPFQNVTVAVDYLAEQIDRYDGDLAKGITAYNKGHYAGKITYYAKAVMKKAEELRGETYVLQNG